MRCWIWWATLVWLFLRSTRGDVIVDVTNSTSSESDPSPDVDKPKNAVELGVPSCKTNYDCVNNGICRIGTDGHGVCLCPRACPANIPDRCLSRRSSCIIMDQDYRSRFDLYAPSCNGGLCVCPPMFDQIRIGPDSLPLRLNTTIPPVKCDKRDLEVIGRVHPSEKVYKGTDVTMYCCINVDPEGFVDAAGVFFIQNTTLMREATNHPFRGVTRKHDERMSCWELEIKNAQPSDSGSYMCLVSSSSPVISANYTIDFEVKAPRMIHNLRVNKTEKTATVMWDSEEGSLIPIDLRNRRRLLRGVNAKMASGKELLRRTDNRGQEVFRKENATSPVLIESLRAATPYTLFVSGKDGTTPFEFTEHFTTEQKRPHAPKEEDVRLLNSGSSLICEVEWKSPAETNGRIIKYFVSVRGEMRRGRPDGSLVADDFPDSMTTDKRCANWNGDESSITTSGINPIDFSTEFFSCKFGPLKPNRNYSVMVWAENNAGKSLPAVFKKNCVTNFAQPDVVQEPATTMTENLTTFSLMFNNPPDDTNGPISCFYIAIVPLLANVSLDTLPPPSEIVMDSFVKAFSNNMHGSAAEKRRYFAYIAESYGGYPGNTVIGDGATIPDIRPCNVQYLSRYTAEDLELRRGMKYTGFLIVRVDKEEDLKSDAASGSHFLKNVLERDREKNSSKTTSSRTLRQLHLSGPAYGYSGYFKPVFLPTEDGGTGYGTALKVFVPIFVFLAMVTAVGMFILQRRNAMIRSWCLSRLMPKDGVDRALLKPIYNPVPLEELPTEYIIRHRDSDFLFAQEYESLPHFALESSASTKKENSLKNRYNDIRAFDETRVKLNKIEGDENSDYINANYVKSWTGEKTFIAAQAPLDTTIADFWRMVWEQESYLIIMVTNLNEKNRQKCAKYWPDDAPMEFGEILVRPVESTYFSDFAVRSFDVTYMNLGSLLPSRFSPTPSNCNESHASSEYANVPVIRNSAAFASNTRRVFQYHYMNWSDYKAPESSTGLLRFVHVLRQLPQFNESPVVIHCSAGVGRTGTLMAIDSMLDQCEAEGKADIFGFVAKLRRQRNFMVQSQDQYVFIYKALAEWHLYGYTDMDSGQFREHFRNLTQRNRISSFNGITTRAIAKDEHLTGMEAEFRKLDRSLETSPKSTFAHKDENLLKNRFEAAVPYDRNRVILSPAIGQSDATYINASNIKGYFYPYIAAQDPVSEGTAYDFWRMITDQEVATVVMLSQEEEWSLSEKYWPEELNRTMTLRQGRNLVEVTMVEEERSPYFITRRLVYDMKTDGSVPAEVVQFAFTGWPTDEVVPSDSAPLLSLIGRVLEQQSGLAACSPILLHCRNGSSETGVYCCLSLLLLRWKTEQRIDVFQTVRDLQVQRPMMFSRIEQYEFCYKAVHDYISHRC
ncbi:unnamed protein product [Caenorhabditis auriculariae]|uniref:protein-tyrosine-phosphatase n=1 Tax=Caenorhabditis auriculariae TaxID=2777116 RepID=A0A8S1HI90_9PELO|nr:unnamed protein product [Caenorhabditis auriculariae]